MDSTRHPDNNMNQEATTKAATNATTNKIALFVTCLVNSLRPGVGFAAVKLLETAGFQVVVPRSQTCCGQPNYNNGDSGHGVDAARHFIEVFEPFATVLVPSASCAGMIKHHYPRLLAEDPHWSPRAKALAERVQELTAFLGEQLEKLPRNPDFKGTLTHHDSCSALREMKVTGPVRQLIGHCLPNAVFTELSEPEACCGFGGTFCIKFNDVSRKMGSSKLNDINATGAGIATSQDLGCLLQLESLSQKPHASPDNPPDSLPDATTNLQLLHLAELLARETCP